MNKNLDEILCPIGEGYHWYKAFVELKPILGKAAWLFNFEEAQMAPAVGGGFIYLVLAGPSIREVIDRVEDVARKENVELVDIISVQRVEDLSDLPTDEETETLDPAISECIDAGFNADSVAFSVIYLYPENKDQI